MNKKTKKITIAAMFTAMTYVLTMFLKFPLVCGYVHLGDVLIYLGASIVGEPWMIFVGALGQLIADFTGGYVMYAPATFIIKSIVALPYVLLSSKSSKILTTKTALLTIITAAVIVFGYFVFDLFINKAYAFANLVGNVIQSVLSAIIFVALAKIFDCVNIKSKFKE